MNDLLDRAVRSALDDYFAAAPVPGVPPALRLTRTPARSTTTPRIVAIAAGVTVTAGVAGALTVADRPVSNTGAPPAVASVTAAEVPTSVPSPAENPGFQASVLPEGFGLSQVMPATSIEGDPRPRYEGGTVVMVLGRRDESGAIIDKIDVSVEYGRIYSPPLGAGYTREGITVGGVPGEIVRSRNGDSVWVGYQLGEQAVQVGAAAGDDEQVVEDMIQVANAMTVDEATAELTGRLPVGYEVLAAAPSHPRSRNTSPTTLFYSDGANVNEIGVSFEADPPDDFQYWYMASDLAETQVRGHQAFVTSRRHEDLSWVAVMWLERPDLLITVSGRQDVTLDDVIAAAESLQPMTDDEWAALLLTAGDSPTPGAAITTVAAAPAAAGGSAADDAATTTAGT